MNLTKHSRPARPGAAATKTAAGLWIDHRRAFIVLISPTGYTSSEIHSGVEHEPSRVDGIQATTPYESRLVQADDHHQRAFTGHLSRYYDQIATVLNGIDSIVMFGPGEAKGECRKHLETTGSAHRTIAVEAAGNMTLPQITAKVHAYFPRRKS